MIREERPENRDAVRRVEEAAFEQPDEADSLERIDEPVVLLRHVDYYTRFGFRPAAPEGIANQWGIDDSAWMVRGVLAPGPVRYPQAFGA